MKLLLILVAALLAGCAAKPYAIIDGSQSAISDSDNYDVEILSIDGKMRPRKRSEKVSPGFHTINLVSTKPLKTKGSSFQAFPLDAKECMRYVVTAQHNNSVSDEWEVKILRATPIPSCTPSDKEAPETASLPAYLTTDTASACKPLTALSSSDSPRVLYPALQDCVQQGKAEQAIYHYFQASAYGFYDAARVYDGSAHAALEVLQKHTTWTLAPHVQSEFEQTLSTFIQNPDTFSAACQFLRQLGKPAYAPDYMVEHGVMRLSDDSEQGLKKDFQADDAWETVLTRQLGCA
ncbi:hypothetical protein LJ739_18510 [Aestuariibacter halophilus]|uniref:Lipoprotein n=1 Tax=Fluctibacter halophilus TaxID=226011 RepID=A0ABS8GGE9_9ALTE|nr:hypothetical protein [Aestuariibacter halophilus]MCC2618256.1 hypothetical protein [Aestuariibacter halophilus]